MQDKYTETHDTWNSIAQDYEDKFMDLALYDDTYLEFCELLGKSNKSVLEIGCGPGNITRRLLEINSNLEILATDVSENMVELAAKNNPSIRTAVLDCRDLNSINSKFDGIVCGFTVPYLSKEDVKALIANCAKLLNTTGVLYLSFVEGVYEDSVFISGSSGLRTLFHYYDIPTITNYLGQNGFVITNQTVVSYEKKDGSIEKHIVINAASGA